MELSDGRRPPRFSLGEKVAGDSPPDEGLRRRRVVSTSLSAAVSKSRHSWIGQRIDIIHHKVSIDVVDPGG